ncbi:hypothetical protein SAVIM40S_08185 [Streptomyces avidinii]
MGTRRRPVITIATVRRHGQFTRSFSSVRTHGGGCTHAAQKHVHERRRRPRRGEGGRRGQGQGRAGPRRSGTPGRSGRRGGSVRRCGAAVRARHRCRRGRLRKRCAPALRRGSGRPGLLGRVVPALQAAQPVAGTSDHRGERSPRARQGRRRRQPDAHAAVPDPGHPGRLRRGRRSGAAAVPGRGPRTADPRDPRPAGPGRRGALRDHRHRGGPERGGRRPGRPGRRRHPGRPVRRAAGGGRRRAGRRRPGRRGPGLQERTRPGLQGLGRQARR